ncbi:hypothetical protein G432_05375 [Sphingomonas sp. MM-1]|uniref:archaellin/type IV pilin N-terminal domain-containing protein n=1 Tax=Sphingomonas sp. MM-1 TaxID=745310 RepID=UPI0002C1372A|nr:archaellin/type IV pilin N-terminal domain-containing protein [Sphingomonas sp. MM-1]AGH48802.1 hypothetical protein G432_05375 [Sphingomonas sp. MM-1]
MDDKAAMSPVKGLLILLAVIVVLAGYIAAVAALHLSEAWAGFLFLLYWSMVEQARVDRLAKSIIGAFVGAGTAAMMALLPPLMGAGPGMALFLAVVLLLVYAIIMGWAPIAVNMATMIFLTVGTVPHVQANADFLQIFYGIAAGIVYFGGLALIAGALSKKKAATPAEA